MMATPNTSIYSKHSQTTSNDESISSIHMEECYKEQASNSRIIHENKNIAPLKLHPRVKKGKLSWIGNVATRFWNFFRPRRKRFAEKNTPILKGEIKCSITSTVTTTPLHQNKSVISNSETYYSSRYAQKQSSTKSKSTLEAGLFSTSKVISSTSTSIKLPHDEKEDQRRFHDWYELVKVINAGTFSRVYLAFHKFSGEFVAVKKIEKNVVKEELQRTLLEIEALKTLDHPNICKLYQVFNAPKHLLIVLEMCRGDLLEVIQKKKRIKERLAKKIFAQMANAVDYIHSKGFAHRDLKPENVLFDEYGNAKLIDFNLSARISYRLSGWNKLTTHCGTIEYAAPELVKPDEYYTGPPVDSWSMGVVLFVMLTGTLPFEEPQRKLKILSGYYEIPSHLSVQSRHLLQHLLQVNPQSRLTPAQMLNHVWVSSNYNHQRVPESVRYYPQNNTSLDQDQDIVEYLSNELNMPPALFKNRVQQKRYNTLEMGTYKIFERKKEDLGIAKFERWLPVWKQKRTRNVKSLTKYATSLRKTRN